MSEMGPIETLRKFFENEGWTKERIDAEIEKLREGQKELAKAFGAIPLESEHIYIEHPHVPDTCWKCGASYGEHVRRVLSHDEMIEERQRKERYRRKE